MAANPPKEKRKARVKLREVCADCGKAKNAEASNSVTAWIFGFHGCECKTKEVPSPDGQLVSSALAKDTPNGNNRTTQAPIPTLGDKYDVIEPIGHGGMGIVYRVNDKVLGKEFAIKVLREDLAADEASIKRFEQEAKFASELTHANVLSVYSNGRTTSGAPYIVMDYLEGESLAEVLSREGTLDPSRAINISSQICSALAHAHMKGLIHRDLKPSNVMLTKTDAGADIVKVLDFGIAKLMPSSNRDTQNLTQTGELFGTPSYLSPEQCLACNLDTRSDVYSLGCMMYEMLTGKPPFTGSNPIQTIVQHLNTSPLPISAIAPDLEMPDGLESIIMRCLEKEPVNRYESMDHLRHDLELVSTGQKPKPSRRLSIKPIPLTSLIVLTVALLGIHLAGYILSAIHILFYALLPEGIIKSLAPSAPLGFTLWKLRDCLDILCAGAWITTLGQLCAKQSKTWSTTGNTSPEKWSTATLICFFIGCTSFVVLTIWTTLSLPGYANVAYGSSIGGVCFLTLAFISSVVWLFLKGTSAIKLRPATRKKLRVFSDVMRAPAVRNSLTAFAIVASLVVLIISRPYLASVIYTLGTPKSTIPDRIDISKERERPTHTDSARNWALFLNPEFAEAHYERGLSGLLNNRYDAIEDFTKVIDLHPGKPLEVKALRQRAKLYFSVDDYEKAANDLDTLIKLDPETGTGKNSHGSLGEFDYYNRALCYEKSKQYEKAVADYSTAIVNSDQHPCSYIGRARAYEQLGNDRQALADYSSALKTASGNLQIYIDRAALYKKLGEPDKADEDYKTVLQKFQAVADGSYGPLAFNPYRCLAVAEQHLGMRDAATGNFAKAIEYDKQRESRIKDMDEHHFFEL